jgi:fermentation-respiration switch protein FrsA (DUF1100 family)
MYSAMGHAIGADLMERYEFDCEGDRPVGNLHLSQGAAHGVAILTGPLTSVKEQATGTWASALAERGFVALSFDHRYYGESAGRPRQLENPAAKIADIQAAAAPLHGDRRFASTPMFAVGICAGGGYMARAVAAAGLRSHARRVCRNAFEKPPLLPRPPATWPALSIIDNPSSH